MENKLVSQEVMLSDQAVGTSAGLHRKSVVVHTVAFCSEPGFLWIAVIQHSYTSTEPGLASSFVYLKKV